MSKVNLKFKQRNLRQWLEQIPLLHYRPVLLLSRVAGEMVTRDATHMAGGVAYFALFSIFPFVLGAMVISGYLSDSGETQQKFLEFVFDRLPGSAVFIGDNVTQLVEQRSALLTLSIIAVLWSSGSVFSAINRVVNRAWAIYRIQPFHISRLRHLLALLIFMGLFSVSVTLSTLIQLLGEQNLGFPGQQVFLAPATIALLLELSSWGVTCLAFLLMYRLLPNCRVYWRHVWLGAVVAATLFELCQVVFSVYIPTSAGARQIYGSIASAIIFLFWVYLSAMILTLGAEICSQYQKIYHPEDVEDDEPNHVWSSY